MVSYDVILCSTVVVGTDTLLHTKKEVITKEINNNVLTKKNNNKKKVKTENWLI